MSVTQFTWGPCTACGKSSAECDLKGVPFMDFGDGICCPKCHHPEVVETLKTGTTPETADVEYCPCGWGPKHKLIPAHVRFNSAREEKTDHGNVARPAGNGEHQSPGISVDKGTGSQPTSSVSTPRAEPIAYIGTVPGHGHRVMLPDDEVGFYPCADPKCPTPDLVGRCEDLEKLVREILNAPEQVQFPPEEGWGTSYRRIYVDSKLYSRAETLVKPPYPEDSSTAPKSDPAHQWCEGE